MKITIKDMKEVDDNYLIEYLVEKEEGVYNNIVETILIPISETNDMDDDEVLTLGYDRIKQLAIRVFSAIEYNDEDDNPVGFKIKRKPIPEPTVYVPDPLESLVPSFMELEKAEYIVKLVDALIELEVI